MIIDLQKYPCPTRHLEVIRDRISSLILYRGLAGKATAEVKIYRADYDALIGAFRAKVTQLDGFSFGEVRVVAVESTHPLEQPA